MILWTIITLIIGYGIGCLHGSVIAQKFSGIDLKTTGLKNAGASNATIVLGKRYGALVAVVDIGKGVLAVLLVRMFAIQIEMAGGDLVTLLFLAGVAAVLGHNFPVYMSFNGGKGTATIIGVLLALDWKLGLIGLGLLIVTAIITNFLVYGVFMLYVIFLIASFFSEEFIPIILAFLLLGIAVWKHLENFSRMKNGTENRVSAALKK